MGKKERHDMQDRIDKIELFEYVKKLEIFVLAMRRHKSTPISNFCNCFVCQALAELDAEE